MINIILDNINNNIQIRRRILLKNKKYDDLPEICLNKKCDIFISLNIGSYSKAVILESEDNWIKVIKKDQISIINIDHIVNIKIYEKKEINYE